jgi:hypothetical protein
VHDLDQDEDQQDLVEQGGGGAGYDRPAVWKKVASPSTTRITASPMSTTPTVTVTKSCACSSAQIVPATPRGRAGLAAASSAGSGMISPSGQSLRSSV